MSKFGLDMENDAVEEAQSNLASKLANFPPSSPKTTIDLVAVDAAAAVHGFISREAGGGRRRRVVPSEPKRQLSIMLPESKFQRFVAYADKHRLTYEEALSRLLAAAID